MVADIEELEEMDASELHARRLNAKEVLTPMRHENFMFPVADGTVKIFEKKASEHPLQPRIVLNEERNNKFLEENQTDYLLQPHFKMTQHVMKLKMTSGLLREISFITITWNPESNCTCRKKNHFLFRRSTSTLPETLIHHLM